MEESPELTDDADLAEAQDKGRAAAGTQTLARGLDILDAVVDRPLTLADLAERLKLTRSTTYRLAGALVERRYLNFSRGSGYGLGPRLLEMGHLAARQTNLRQVAREHLEDLAARTGDTVHLGVLDESNALYLDKIRGTRRVEVSSRIGERQPLRSTGLGKALILDSDEDQLRKYYDYEARKGAGYSVSLDDWLGRMHQYAKAGYALDLEENEDRIRCVAAPIRDVTGAIAGAISISSAAQYMDDLRMHGLAFEVKGAAEAVSRELGYSPEVVAHSAAPGAKAGKPGARSRRAAKPKAAE